MALAASSSSRRRPSAPVPSGNRLPAAALLGGFAIALLVGVFVVGPWLTRPSTGGGLGSGKGPVPPARPLGADAAAIDTIGGKTEPPSRVLALDSEGPPPAPSCPAVPKHLLQALAPPAGCPSCSAAESSAGLIKFAAAPLQDSLPPKIVPSLYARVHGEEPFERKSNGVWEMHTIPTSEWLEDAQRRVDRCMADQAWPDDDAMSDDITWVSILLDLKRGEAGNGAFRRSMTEYFERFQRILDRGFKMVIFIHPDFEKSLRIDKSRVKVMPMTVEDLQLYFPYYDRLTKVRTSDVWNRQAKQTGWLSEAPQARLPMYDPLVMSKMNLLRDIARLNPWRTRYLMFMDAGHYCATGLRPEGMPLFKRMMSKFFLTHWAYGTQTEVHGLLDKAMHLYMGTAQDPMQIVRGGVFGGRRRHIECAASIYNVVLAQTLRDGYMGTEENILAIIFQHFPALFNGFDNDSLGNPGDNCASFSANEAELRSARGG